MTRVFTVSRHLIALPGLLACAALLGACASSDRNAEQEAAEPQARYPTQEMQQNALGDREAEDESGGWFSGLRGLFSSDRGGERPMTYQERERQRRGGGGPARQENYGSGPAPERRQRDQRQEWDPAAMDSRDQEIRELEMELAMLEAGEDDRGFLQALRGLVVPGGDNGGTRDFQQVQRERYQSTTTSRGGERRMQQSEREERIAALREELEQRERAAWDERLRETERSDARGPRTRVGVILSGEDRDRLETAFKAAALDMPIRLISDRRTRDAVERAGCSIENASACAETLRRDLGLRMLIEVRVTDDQRVAVRNHDLEMQGAMSERRLAPGTPSGRVSARSLEELGENVLRDSLEQARRMPWFARPVDAAAEERWIINAGRASGLTAGQQLRVHQPGRLIRGPEGQPRSWLRGPAIGVVEVTDLEDEDRARVRLLDGQGPASESVLIPQG
ncbi:hypothetical protein M0534_09835 [Methylonatrum kenyense]|uniref:hypothetical protein n=1 Tax=Methylonatrum kenyense TaxID=455253 RepID=UPI0020BEEE68|nr:hypothetical protein [Methylonatrum kenyense]MCK8516621.1 hypothetical protein [Methylonatrum kenyense]